MFTLYIAVAVAAYLLGSIPFGYLLVWLARGEDIRLSGSGNIGATNVARIGAKRLGALTLLLDALKGFVAVLLAWRLAYHNDLWMSSQGDPGPLAQRLAATAAVFAVLGHMFPVWLRFKGGKGVATALGVFLFLFPKAVPLGLAIFVLVVAATRYVSLGSIVAAIAFPIAAYAVYHPDWISLLLVAAVSVLVILKHHQNIRRLIAGNENRFGRAKASAEKQT